MGSERRLDISKYADEKLSAKEMEMIYNDLKNESLDDILKKEKVKLPDNRVPKSSMENPNKTTKIEDNKVPLSDMAPKTGDKINLPVLFGFLIGSILLFTMLIIIAKKEKAQ